MAGSDTGGSGSMDDSKKKVFGFNHPLRPQLMRQLCKCRTCGTTWYDEYMGYAVINGARMYDYCSECPQKAPDENA